MSALPVTEAVSSAGLSEADRIRLEMVRVRGELHDDVEEVVASARALTDWRRYVRSYPWACLGAAAVVGYWIVPRRAAPKIKIRGPKSVASKAGSREEAAEDAAVESGVKAGAAAGLLGSLVSMAGTMALRGAMNFASKKATDWINAKLGDQPSPYSSPSSAPSSAPSEPMRREGGPKLYHAPPRPRMEGDV